MRGGKVRCNYFARSKDGIDVVHGECYQEVLLGDSSLLLGLSRVLIVTFRIRLKYDGRSLCFSVCSSHRVCFCAASFFVLLIFAITVMWLRKGRIIFMCVRKNQNKNRLW